MALTYSTIFGRLGRLFAHAASIRTFQGTLETEYASTVAEYSGGDMNQIGRLSQGLDSRIVSAANTVQDLEASAVKTLIDMTDANFTLEDLTVTGALRELIRQMIADSQLVAASTITVGSVTAGSGNIGNGTLVVSSLSHAIDEFGNRTDNVYAQNMHSETLQVICRNDSSQNLIDVGSEHFVLRGQRKLPITDTNWPGGSGANSMVSAVNPKSNGGSGPGQNICTNSNFEDFVSNEPQHWNIDTGVAGTHILEVTSGQYAGSKCIKFVGDGSTTPKISQTLNSTLGSRGYLNPDQPYTISFAAKYATLAPGVSINVEVTKSDGTTIYQSGDLYREMSNNVTSGSLTTSWQLFTATGFMPTDLDKGSKVVVTFSGNIANTSEVFIDNLCVAQMRALGKNIGHAQVIPGSTAFRQGDSFEVAITNNGAGEFCQEFDRFFDMSARGLSLPATLTGGSVTISDALIA